MKAINLFFIILFLASAALQYNDPDPYLWIPIYLFGAFLCFRGFRGQYQPILYRMALIIFSFYAMFLFFNNKGVLSWLFEHNAESIVQSMEASKPWIEQTREFIGLLILIAAVAFNMIQFSRISKSVI